MNDNFWNALDALATTSEVKIDRPQNSIHPRYPDYIYPHDYGYFDDTRSSDGAEIDVWQINKSKEVTGIIVTFDPIKKDSEIKVLLGASREQAEEIKGCHERGDMQAMLIMRD